MQAYRRSILNDINMTLDIKIGQDQHNRYRHKIPILLDMSNLTSYFHDTSWRINNASVCTMTPLLI